MRKTIIAANWKMNGNQAGNQALIEGFLNKTPQLQAESAYVFVPFPYLVPTATLLQNTPVQLGAQSLSAYSDGAFTGEVSAHMLVDCGVKAVLIGHSERRTLFNESENIIIEKLRRAQEAGLEIFFCVGETLAQREAGEAFVVVKEQLAAFQRAGFVSLKNVVIAYEPVWAIGTGRVPAVEDAQAMHAHMRSVLAEAFPEAEKETNLLYGGSVKANNVGQFLVSTDIDGALVGGASLDANEFAEILSAAGVA